MLALYHGCCDPSPKAIQAGTQLTDSRDYAEYVGRALARAAGRAHCYVHELEADHHEMAYVGRLKVNLPVKATVQRDVWQGGPLPGSEPRRVLTAGLHPPWE